MSPSRREFRMKEVSAWGMGEGVKKGKGKREEEREDGDLRLVFEALKHKNKYARQNASFPLL